ncbi:transcription factor RF2b-like [Phalaenopsis equestris]|uniref:transcription factor RF2b-like n=1 Tax=Phalaenopsis equestris TaxID=78828 RepID=UPI0009E499DA|nr:transcription factor RF2b-like [Phalaenopsis equestris]
MNDNLKNEVERLKIITGETTISGEANKAIPNPLSFNPSFFSNPQPPPSLPHQPIHLPPPFHPPQYAAAAAAPTSASYFPLLSYSHLLGAPIPHDHLGRLQRSDFSKAALRIKAESCSSLSAGESSSNF